MRTEVPVVAIHNPLFRMKYAIFASNFLAILCCHNTFAAESPDDFYATSETVGRTSEGLETPDNQRVTPAGTLVELPGLRPNAIALSPNGRILVTSGMTHQLVVIDAEDGNVLQEVRFPEPKEKFSAEAGSELVLNASHQDKLSFTGLVFSPDGKRIYLSNVNGDIKVFGIGADERVSPLFSIPLPAANMPDRTMDIPTGIAVSADGKKIYVALNVANKLLELDANNGQILRTWDVGVAPFGVARCGNKIYVSNWGGRRPDKDSIIGPIGRNGIIRVDGRGIADEGSVSEINLDAKGVGKNRTLEILTGRHACALSLTPNEKFLACANAGDDSITIIDTRTDKIIETICARQNAGDLFGAQPDALSFDRHGKTLFACNGSQNAIAVFAFKAGESKMLGLIPVGWFPGGIVFDARRHQVDVANLTHMPANKETPLKGRAGRGVGFNSKQWFGSLSLVSVSMTKSQLAKFTQAALENLRYPLLAKAKLPPRENAPVVPVPERVGEPSVFQHVIYFIKENRSYDQVLGDVGEGNGDADLCIFGEHITPNQHKFVRDFTLLDNTYCSGIMSADGHHWTDSGIANDYLERSFNGWPRSYPGAGGDPHGYDALAYASSGFIWDDVLDHKKSVCIFGEFTHPHHFWKRTGRPQSGWLQTYRDFVSGSNAIDYSAEVGLPDLRPYTETNYLGFDLTVPDALRAGRFIEDFKKFESEDKLPNLLVVWLPDDHTSGTKFGAPTPEAQVADNDLAFGRIVEAVSHSKYWTNTCIFAIEDDPQDGWDHVSGYRTTAYVISPYTKRHAVVHTQYNQTSLLRTMELILGIPPMNQLDATATPMFDCFTETPDFAPFDIATNNVPLDEMNPNPKNIQDAQLRRDAFVSARLPLDKEDQCPEDLFNHIIWRSAKGPKATYPDWAVKDGGDDD